MEKGAPIKKSNKVPNAFRVPESGNADAAPTPETLLRKYDLLGKSLWIAMGAGILITLWTIAAFVAGPAAPLPATTQTESTTVPADTPATAGSDDSSQTVKPSAVDATTETNKPPVDIKQQNSTAKQQVKQPVRRAPAANKVQPEPQQTPELKQPENNQTYEPTDEQQYQQLQQVPQSAD